MTVVVFVVGSTTYNWFIAHSSLGAHETTTHDEFACTEIITLPSPNTVKMFYIFIQVRAHANRNTPTYDTHRAAAASNLHHQHHHKQPPPKRSTAPSSWHRIIHRHGSPPGRRRRSHIRHTQSAAGDLISGSTSKPCLYSEASSCACFQ